MPTSTNVTNLKINELTEAQFDSAVQGGVIGANELSIITDLDEAIQVSTMPTAGAGEVGKVYQFIGTTDANYTHGYFYECVSDGQTPATYSWSNVQVQASSGGLPSQTGNAGKFLTTDGTDASWSDKPLVNTATGSLSVGIGTNAVSGTGSVGINCNSLSVGDSVCVGFDATCQNASSSVCIGRSAQARASHAISIGKSANSTGNSSIAIGEGASATAAGAIQISAYADSYRTNSTANTVCFGNANGNFEMMSADGTIPTDRYTTTPVADGTYVPTLTISSGVATRSWSAPSGGGSTALSLTLASANWSNNSITVTATGVTSSNNVIVSPAPASQSAYTSAGVMCTGQSTDSLTFTCTTTPSSDLTVNVLVLN